MTICVGLFLALLFYLIWSVSQILCQYPLQWSRRSVSSLRLLFFFYSYVHTMFGSFFPPPPKSETSCPSLTTQHLRGCFCQLGLRFKVPAAKIWRQLMWISTHLLLNGLAIMSVGYSKAFSCLWHPFFYKTFSCDLDLPATLPVTVGSFALLWPLWSSHCELTSPREYSSESRFYNGMHPYLDYFRL
jgi:hypothetical protein